MTYIPRVFPCLDQSWPEAGCGPCYRHLWRSWGVDCIHKSLPTICLLHWPMIVKSLCYSYESLSNKNRSPDACHFVIAPLKMELGNVFMKKKSRVFSLLLKKSSFNSKKLYKWKTHFPFLTPGAFGGWLYFSSVFITSAHPTSLKSCLFDTVSATATDYAFN